MSTGALTFEPLVGPPLLNTYDDYVRAWLDVTASAERDTWALARIAASLEQRWGARTDRSASSTVIQRFCQDVGVTRQYLWELVKTHTTFAEPGPPGLTEKLRFKHFRIAAVLADDPHAAVAEAAEKKWSANELARQLKQRRARAFSLDEALGALRAHIKSAVRRWPPKATPDIDTLRRRLREMVDLAANDLANEVDSLTFAPTPQELHALRWIVEEMETFPYVARTFNQVERGRGGDLEVCGGAGGAPIYHTIVDGHSSATRGDVIAAIASLLDGRVTQVGRLALDVARDLATGELPARGLMRLRPEAGGDVTGTIFEQPTDVAVDDGDDDDVPDWVREKASVADYDDSADPSYRELAGVDEDESELVAAQHILGADI